MLGTRVAGADDRRRLRDGPGGSAGQPDGRLIRDRVDLDTITSQHPRWAERGDMEALPNPVD